MLIVLPANISRSTANAGEFSSTGRSADRTAPTLRAVQYKPERMVSDCLVRRPPGYGTTQLLCSDRMRARLHIHIDKLQRRGRLIEHTPALEPVVSSLHLLGGNRRRVADDDAARAQVINRERRDLGIFGLVIVDEIVEVS